MTINCILSNTKCVSVVKCNAVMCIYGLCNKVCIFCVRVWNEVQMLYDLPLNLCVNIIIIIIFDTILLAPAWQSNFITEVPANSICYHREWY